MRRYDPDFHRFTNYFNALRYFIKNSIILFDQLATYLYLYPEPFIEDLKNIKFTLPKENFIFFKTKYELFRYKLSEICLLLLFIFSSLTLEDKKDYGLP